MSTFDVVDSFGDPDRSRWSRIMSTVAHRVIPVATVGLVLSLMGMVYEPLWAVSAPFAFLASLTVMVAYLHQEFGRICVGCMKRVPTDAAERAQRRKWLLRFQHFTNNYRTMWIVLVVMFSPSVIGWLVDNIPHWVHLPNELIYYVFVWALWTHHKLSPWCPYCKPWDDHGPHECTPTPDPTGVKSA